MRNASLVTMPEHDGRQPVVLVPRPGATTARTCGISKYSSSRPTAYIMSFSVKARANASGSPNSACAQLGRAIDRDARSAAPSWRRSAPSPPVHVAPAADGVEVLERETDRIDHAMALVAAGFVRCCSSRARSVFGFSPLGLRQDRYRHRAAAASAACPSVCPSTHAPRSTGDVRSPYDVRISTAPLPSRPHRRGSSSVTRRNCGPQHRGDAVVPREPLVQERVVGGEQIAHVAILEQHAREERLDLGRHVLAQRFVERGKQVGIGHDLVRACRDPAT